MEGIALNKRYRIEKKLGEGSFGKVFLAFDEESKRRVAIKLLKKEHLDNISIDRLKREFFILGKSNSPNLVNVFDFHSDSKNSYFTMEYIDGHTMDYNLSRKIDINQTLESLNSLCLGLEHIHSRGIIHNDLKPENIFCVNGSVKIADFGLASTVEKQGVSGSLAYLAPERILGQKGSAKSDLYSLGIIIVEALTGNNPFQGKTPQETIEKQLSLIYDIKGNYPFSVNSFNNALLKLLDKNPYKRLSSAYFMRVAIAELLGKSLTESEQLGSIGYGPMLLDNAISNIIQLLESNTGKTNIDLKANDSKRYEGFQVELDKALQIKEASFFVVDDIDGFSKKIINRASEFDSLKPIIEDWENLINDKSSSRNDKILVIADLIESYSSLKPSVLDLLPCNDELLKKRLNRLMERGNLILLGDKGNTKISIDPFSDKEIEQYLSSVLNPLKNLDRLSPYISTQTGGSAIKIDQVLRSLIQNRSLIQTNQGWMFTEPKLQLQDLGLLSEIEKRMVDILSISQKNMPASILQELFDNETMMDVVHVLLQKGIIGEKKNHRKSEYYIIDKSAIPTIRQSINNKVLREISEAIDRIEQIDDFWIVIQLEILYRIDEKVALIDKANKLLISLKKAQDYASAKRVFVLLAKTYESRNLWKYALKNLKMAGLMSKYLGLYNEGLNYYEKALDYAEKADSQLGYSNILNDIGVLYFEKGEINSALEYYEKSTDIAEEIENPKSMLRGYSNIGNCHLMLYQLKAADRYYKIAKLISVETENLRMNAVVSFNWGSLKSTIYEYDEAINLFEEALEYSEKEGLKKLRFEILLNLAWLYFRNGFQKLSNQALKKAQNSKEITRLTFYRFLLLEFQIKRSIWAGNFQSLNELFKEIERYYARVPFKCQSNITKLYKLARWDAGETLNSFDFKELEYYFDDYKMFDLESPNLESLLSAIQRLFNQGDSWGATVLAIITSRMRPPGISILKDALRNIKMQEIYLRGLLNLEIGRKHLRAENFQEGIDTINKSRVFFGKCGNSQKIEEAENALENVKRKESHLQVQDTIALLEVINSINENLDFKETLRTILHEVTRISEAERGILFLSRDDRMTIEMAIDSRGIILENPKIRYSRSILRETSENKKALFRESVVEDDELSSRDSVVDLDIKMVLCVPLVFEDKLLGALYTDARVGSEVFSSEKRNILVAMAKSAAIALNNADRYALLKEKNANLMHNFIDQYSSHNIIGNSQPMRKLYHRMSIVSPQDVSLLLIGETGTGKDLIARTIHNESPRKDKSFIAINCAAVPENLLESELFGYEKGAFTGATGSKPGKFELADEGTIFLNEIGEMPPLLQAKLLTILENQTFQRLGGTKDIKVNVRIIAATNKNLQECINLGTFREDLFYRLSSITLSLPALRDRKSDIPGLIVYFIDKAEKNTGRKIDGIEKEALTIMQNYKWPGNVRQLKNAIEEMVLFAETDFLRLHDLPNYIAPSYNPIKGSMHIPETYSELNLQKAEIEKQALIQALESSGWVIAQAARNFGIHRTRLHQLINKYDIKNDVN